jgi:hypothetical protein
MLTLFHNPYIRAELTGHLFVKHVQIGTRTYYMIQECLSDLSQTRTIIPSQWIQNRLSPYDILELYAGKSLKVEEIFGEQTTGYYIVATNDHIKKQIVGKKICCLSFMHLTPIVPCYNKATKSIDGYVCKNIFVPQTIQITKVSWTLNETDAANLICHGKIVDMANGRMLAITNFKKAKSQAAKKERLQNVRFIETKFQEKEMRDAL